MLDQYVEAPKYNAWYQYKISIKASKYQADHYQNCITNQNLIIVEYP